LAPQLEGLQDLQRRILRGRGYDDLRQV